MKYKCDECKHMVFDEKWGEYKCKKKYITIYHPEKQNDCKDFAKTTDKEKKE